MRSSTSAHVAEEVRRGPSWQLLTPPPSPSGHQKGTFLPPWSGNWNINSLWAKLVLEYCWTFWTHWGSCLQTSDNTCWISERTGWGFCWRGGTSVLHCLNWQQVLTAAFLSYLWCGMASADIALTGRHDERRRTTTPARAVSCYGKKLAWMLQEGLWCGDSQLQVLPASCFPPCMVHLCYFWNISSVSFVYILLQLSTHTPLQRNVVRGNTSERAMSGTRVRRQMSETFTKAPNLSREACCKYTVEVTKL